MILPGYKFPINQSAFNGMSGTCLVHAAENLVEHWLGVGDMYSPYQLQMELFHPYKWSKING